MAPQRLRPLGMRRDAVHQVMVVGRQRRNMLRRYTRTPWTAGVSDGRLPQLLVRFGRLGDKQQPQA